MTKQFFKNICDRVIRILQSIQLFKGWVLRRAYLEPIEWAQNVTEFFSKNCYKNKIILLLLFSTGIYSEEDSTFSHLKSKERYFYLTEQLYHQELQHLKLNAPKVQLFKNIKFEFSYTTITISDDAYNKEVRLYVEISKQFHILEIWNKDPSRIKLVEDYVHDFEKKDSYDYFNSWFSHLENKELIKNLRTADKIARVGSHCTSGDEYSPWLYSKISIHENIIELEQTNYWNAKSLNKKSYSMRKLILTIPIDDNKNFSPINHIDPDYKYHIDNIAIEFSDHSSPTHKECGSKIKSVIEKEMEL